MREQRFDIRAVRVSRENIGVHRREFGKGDFVIRFIFGGVILPANHRGEKQKYKNKNLKSSHKFISIRSGRVLKWSGHFNIN